MLILNYYIKKYFYPESKEARLSIHDISTFVSFQIESEKWRVALKSLFNLFF